MENDIWLVLKGIWNFIKEYGFLLTPFLTLFIPSVRKNWLRFYNKSYTRYCKELVTRFKNEEPFDNFPDLKLIAKSTLDSPKELALSEILKSGNGIHIQGKPGSGKTSLIKKFIVEFCDNHRFTRPKWIPVYIKNGSRDLFNEILNSLIEKNLVKNPTHFDTDWLKDQLKKEFFLIIIDDAHNLLSNEDKRALSKIDNLFEYNKNKFVLISRDYYSACPFQFNLYEIQDLSNNRDIAEQILKVHAGEGRFQRVWMHLQYGYKKELLQLYKTPQLLKLLANVFDQKEKFDDNKSFLFKRFLKTRHYEESRKSNEILPLELKEKVLGSLAYKLFINLEGSAYSVPYHKFRKMLMECVQEIRKNLGFTEYSVDSIFEGLKEEGLLIQYDELIEFEHDQWQEFFAALEIHREEKSITPFLSKTFGGEIALFVSGFYQLEEELTKRIFWKNFWEELVLSDFFLTKWCRDNRISYTLRDIGKVYENFTYNEEKFFTAYKSVLVWYKKIIDRHFPNLLLKFAPSGTKYIGLLVEQNENKVGQLYGYRPITTQNKDQVVFTNQKEIMRLINADDPLETINYYKEAYDISYLHSYMGTSAVQSYPVEFAFMDVEKQLSDFVRDGNLIETEIMEEEALYIEAISLSKMLKGRRSGISNTSKQYVLPIGELLEGLDKLKNDRFHSTIKVPESTLSHGGLPRRDVDLEDFESRLRKHMQKKQLAADDRIVSPNADLIEIIKNYRFRKDELTIKHREFLIKRSGSFYKEFYENYKKVLEVNFPTAKQHFRTSFPVQVFLIQKGDRKERFGERLVYFNVKGLNKPVDVKIVDEEDEKKIKYEYRGYYGVSTYWGLKTFSIIEPIRNAVYSLIQDEYEKLNRNYGHSVM